MAKGGYQKRRIAQRKQELRARRKRHARNRKILTYVVVIALITAFGGAAIAVFLSGSTTASPASSLTPTASPTPTPVICHTPSAADNGKKTFPGPPCMSINPARNYAATIVTTKGSIQVSLFAKQAPQTVNNFVFLALHNFFNGLKFHRVLPNFGGPKSDMIQGGDPLGTGLGGPGYQFKSENAIPFDQPGYLAMANSGPDTNGSQFFFLDGKWNGGNGPQCQASASTQGCYSVFGKVIKGLDVIHAIATVPGTPIPGQAGGNEPKIPVKILSISIAVR